MQPSATPAEMIPVAIQSLRVVAERLVLKAMKNPASKQATVATMASSRMGDQ